MTKMFSARRNGVQTPVDEHAKARFTPPLHARIALGFGFGRVRIERGRLDLRLDLKRAAQEQGTGQKAAKERNFFHDGQFK